MRSNILGRIRTLLLVHLYWTESSSLNIPSSFLNSSHITGFQDLTLITKYIIQHNKFTILKDLCDRNYVIGRYACPMSVGNRLHEFLNGLAGAIITNRTILWEYKYKWLVPSLCHSHFTRYDWIASAEEMLPKIQKCKGSSKDLSHPSSSIIHFHNRTKAEASLVCCGLDEIPNQIIDFGTLERQEMFALNYSGSKLSSMNRNRTNLLFIHGPDFTYGLLMRFSFEFTPITIESNNRVFESIGLLSGSSSMKNSSDIQTRLLPSVSNSILNLPISRKIISMHIRHSRVKDTGSNTKMEEECLLKVMKNITTILSKTEPCVVLLASDREPTIQRLTRFLTSIDCHVVTSSRNGSSSSSVSKGEHGPWADSFVSLLDIELLSRYRGLIVQSTSASTD